MCDLVVSIIGKMADYTYVRREKAKKMIKENQLIVSRAMKDHQVIIGKGNRCMVWLDEKTDSGVCCTVKSGCANGGTFAVEIKLPSLDFTCGCKFSTEHQRPCKHVVATAAAIEGLNVWDTRFFGKCWFAQTWANQHNFPVKRFRMHLHEFAESNLIPAHLPNRPDKPNLIAEVSNLLTHISFYNLCISGAKKKRSYEMSAAAPRKCQTCGGLGHFAATCPSPNMDTLLTSKAKEIGRAVKNYIDLTQDD